MISRLFLCILIGFVVGCRQKSVENSVVLQTYSNIIAVSDTLFAVSDADFEPGSSCGYKNKKGNIVIPIKNFQMCFTDTFSTFAYVFDKNRFGKNMVAINRNQQRIFDVFIFDNGPDYLSDGLFRIRRNGKIGYADANGKVIIEPKFTCAFPFENGKAKVAYDCETIQDDLEHSTWESENWFFIDKRGSKIAAE